MIKLKIVFILLILKLSFINGEVVFMGKPLLKVNEKGVTRSIENISKNDQLEYIVTITMSENKYFWASRNNVELIRVLSGAYTNFIAVNGAGYIKVLRTSLRETLDPYLDKTEKTYDYIEHMSHGLKTISYYGKEIN